MRKSFLQNKLEIQENNKDYRAENKTKISVIIVLFLKAKFCNFLPDPKKSTEGYIQTVEKYKIDLCFFPKIFL